MMECKEIQKLFIPFIDDKLSVSDLAAFLDHMDTCKECREEYDIYYTVIMGMRYLDERQNISEFKLDSEQKHSVIRKIYTFCSVVHWRDIVAIGGLTDGWKDCID